MSASNNNTGNTGSGSGEDSRDNSQLRDANNIPPSTPSNDGYEADVEMSNTDGYTEEESDDESDSDDESETAEAVTPRTAASARMNAMLQELFATAAGILYEAATTRPSSDSEFLSDSENDEDDDEDEEEEEDEGPPRGLGLPSRIDYLARGNVEGALEQSHPATTGVAREQDTTCRICLEELTGTDPADIMVIMVCGHRFHTGCIMTWFYSYVGCHSTCPVDRRRLFTNPGHEHCGEEHESEESEEEEEESESEEDEEDEEGESGESEDSE